MGAWGGRLRERLRGGFWMIPAGCCTAALLLGLLLPELDRLISDDVPFLFGGGPAGARSVLSALTTSMISLTGLVFSITVVVLQLASSQFSPRVLRTFLRSRSTQLTLGVFAATFLYAVVVLRSVRGDNDVAAFVPRLAVTGAFVLLLASVALFIHYIQHITQSIRVSTIVRSVGDETRALIECSQRTWRDIPHRSPPPLPAPAGFLRAGRPGVLVRVDVDDLVEDAARAGCVLTLRLRVGDYAAAGMPLLAVHSDVGNPPTGNATKPTDGDVDVNAFSRALHLDRERTMEQDIAFGFRQLVDIAERALSPGVNDPTTAVQALNEIHDLLRRLATAPDPPQVRSAGDGRVRLLLRERGFGDYLDLALDEVLYYGADALQVRLRLGDLLDDLQTAARPEHRLALAGKRARLAQVQADAG